MIFAAGRGERMRPLTDHCPKPLLEAGGKPLIVWQIEALARAGLRRIVINHAWLGERFEAALGDGSRFGVTLHYSAEQVGLETAGGVAHARALLEADGSTVLVAVSGDVYSDYDYRALAPRIAALEAAARQGAPAAMHLVMVPNPPFHPDGDFALEGDRLTLTGGARLTFGNIGVYDLRLFDGIADGERLPMTPLYRAAIDAGRASGERYSGRWENVGTPAQLAELDRALRAARPSSPDRPDA
ncbi:N-acetylmuramate alpha-1-phosphate uridylyltransferase MurU [Chitinasiproducens palmae]|nr:nucleotidyltransferase family protein [Chitinasiproducens palmae]